MALAIASDNGNEIQRIPRSPRRCKDTPRYRIVPYCASASLHSSREKQKEEEEEGEGEGEREGGVKKKRRRGRTHRSEKERRRRLKYFRGSRGKAIIEKGFHLAPLFSPARSGGVASRVSSFHLSVLIGHSYFLNSASAMRERAHARARRSCLRRRFGRRSPSRKITSLCIVRVDVYDERNNARAATSLLLFWLSLSLSATTSSSLYTYLRHKNCHGRSQTFLLK
jgi:hypothetical protein